MLPVQKNPLIYKHDENKSPNSDALTLIWHPNLGTEGFISGGFVIEYMT